MKILHVDDESDFLEQTKIFLERENDRLKVETTTSSVEALGMLRDGDYEAVVADYKMPDMNGLELLEALRSRGDDIPFIILTGKGREEVAMNALNMNANYYLRKGVDPGPLYEKLARIILEEVRKRKDEGGLRFIDTNLMISEPI